jgi:hypothetical protein
MATITTCRRKQRRHVTLGTDQASVEVAWPQASGPRHRLVLLDVSTSGLSFSFEEELRDIESGACLPETVIRLGDTEIHGELVVIHVTPQTENRMVCGALFYAATDNDLVKWRAALSGIESVK